MNFKIFYKACFAKVLFSLFFPLFMKNLCALSGGAGIIPYTFKNKKAYILLGQDSYSLQTWSNFGGGCEEYDKDLDDTAAREGFEETMGVLVDPKAKDPSPERNEKTGKEYFRRLFNDDYTVYRKRKKGIFFVRVPYVKTSHFRHVYERLSKRKVDKKFLEKDAFAWVRLSRLKRAIESVNPFIKVSRKKISLKNRTKEIVLANEFLIGLCMYKEQTLRIFGYIQCACEYYYENKKNENVGE